ncbi:hemolysin family protein [Deinococcus sp. YIM 77859]|uniref:hemolysin family protein n=1 Tax=Deinococcus sp. YIM 77859 TaxID=1540221 RepID=UPI0005544173|nr:hemolysin family protein [Deinococcus sp. YIM 77859]
MGNPWLEFGILILLLIVNGFFSGSELGVVSAKRSRLEAAAARGDRGAAAAVRLTEQPGAFLATVQIGITLIGTISAVFAGGSLTGHLEPLLRPLFGSAAGTAASVTVVLLVTFLSLVLGELAPKGIALRNPEALAMRVAPFFTVLSRVARPLVWLLDMTASGLLRLLGLREAAQEVVTEEDVRAVVAQAAESGSLEETETERIASVLRFNDRRVRDLMTPRTEAVTLDLGAPIETLVETVLTDEHDRYLVRDPRSGDVVGQVAVSDVLRALYTRSPLASFVRPAVFIPEAAWAEDALARLEREGRQRLAVVVDEYGDFSGVLSISDLLAELAGVEHPEDENQLVRREDGSLLADGSLPMHELREVLPLPRLGREDFSTLAGYVLDVLGEFPQVGAVARVDGWEIEVVDVDGPRVDRLLIRPPADFVPPPRSEP